MEDTLAPSAHIVDTGVGPAVACGDPHTAALATASEVASVAASLDGQPSDPCAPSTHEKQREQEAQEGESVPFVDTTSVTDSTPPSGPSPASSPLTQHVKTDTMPTTTGSTGACADNAVNAPPTLLSPHTTPEISVTPSDHGSPASVSDDYPDPKTAYLTPDRNQAYDHHHHQHMHTTLSNQAHYRSPTDSDLIDRLRAYRESEVTTPTLEQMGLDQLDEADLRMLLQNAYEVIQEKDRNLGMAAMMGKDLVESNATLQAKYEHILSQLRQQRANRSRQLTPPRRIILSPPPDMIVVESTEDGAPISSDDQDWVDFEPSTRPLHHSFPNSPSHGSSFPSVSFRRSVSTHSGLSRSRSRADIEKMSTLENLNSELQAKVEAVTKDLKQGRRQAFKHHRRVEKELTATKNELERTMSKVQDLEDQNRRLIEASKMIRMRRIMLKNQLPAPGSIPGSTMANMAVEMQGDEATIQEMLAEDNRIFEELKERLQSMEYKNTQLTLQRQEAEKKTQQVAQELTELQKEREELYTTLSELSDLQTAYSKQAQHVKELEQSVTELQSTISTMTSRLSQANSPLLSPVEPSSPTHSLWRRDDADFKALKTIIHGSNPQPVELKSPGLRGKRQPRRTLLAELESEWFRDLSFFGLPRVLQQQQQQQQQDHEGAYDPHHHHHASPGRRHSNGPKAIRNAFDSESESFVNDVGGRVKGWRDGLQQDMDNESVCESTHCIRKRRRVYQYGGSDTEGSTYPRADELSGGRMPYGRHSSPAGRGGEGVLRDDDDDSDLEAYQHQQQRRLHRRRIMDVGESGDEGVMSDASDPHVLHHQGRHRRPSTPGCTCHLYEDDYHGGCGYSSYDDVLSEEESVTGWAHFEDFDASSHGYDKYRDGHYMGYRRRRGIMGMAQGVFLLLRLIWRWCRFMVILSTALGIAIYRGPDALLTDGHY
ncbi:hypothetical protein BGZ73_001916 [Actinomortierella ambigua]|nr:hypothetical protein BGZ73_001916 [Actinomortierella ambigua]